VVDFVAEIAFLGDKLIGFLIPVLTGKIETPLLVFMSLCFSGSNPTVEAKAFRLSVEDEGVAVLADRDTVVAAAGNSSGKKVDAAGDVTVLTDRKSTVEAGVNNSGSGVDTAGDQAGEGANVAERMVGVEDGVPDKPHEKVEISGSRFNGSEGVQVVAGGESVVTTVGDKEDITMDGIESDAEGVAVDVDRVELGAGRVVAANSEASVSVESREKGVELEGGRVVSANIDNSVLGGNVKAVPDEASHEDVNGEVEDARQVDAVMEEVEVSAEGTYFLVSKDKGSNLAWAS
jgi:hypothetical protein